MKTVQLYFCLAQLLSVVWSQTTNAAPIYGGDAFVRTYAGGSQTHQNVSFDSTSAVPSTGVITQALADNRYGSAETAMTSAYASLGSLGGKVKVSSTLGSSPDSAGAFDDLSWYYYWKPKGVPGSVVQAQFSVLYEGVVAGAGTGSSGGTRSTSYVGSSLLGDFDFNLLVNPGPFSVLVSKIYEFNVGDVVLLTSRLTVGGAAELNSSADVDAFNTSKFFIDMLTPGSSYNVEDYAFPTLLEPVPTPTPAPEPSSLALFSAGIVSLALMPLRRRRRTVAWVERDKARLSQVSLNPGYALPCRLA